MRHYIPWESEEPKTKFAPKWSHPMWHDMIYDEKELEEIKKVILVKEKELLNYYSDVTNDGGTGLGPNSLTSKFSKFNIFKWKYDWVDKLRESALNGIYNLEGSETLDHKIYAQCWANVMRRGEQIKPHWHSSYEYSYLGAHVTISANRTRTTYENPYNKFNIRSYENVPGALTIFPSYMVHWTDTHYGDSERITLAMDFLTEEGYNNTQSGDIKNNFCLIE